VPATLGEVNGAEVNVGGAAAISLPRVAPEPEVEPART
jgi:hypothetical protein